MKYNRVITTAVLLVLLATTVPAFAQKGEEQKGGGGQKAQPAQHQAQPQRAPQAKAPQQAKAQPQRAPQAKAPQQAKAQPQRAPQARQSVANNRVGSGGNYGRISNANYSSHFGQGHSFHMGRPQFSGGYNRFQYGGYWFGFNQGWPVGWNYGDDCYVEYIDGAYYMFDVRHPGFRLTLNIF
jgi:hypothetical protein